MTLILFLSISFLYYTMVVILCHYKIKMLKGRIVDLETLIKEHEKNFSVLGALYRSVTYKVDNLEKKI